MANIDGILAYVFNNQTGNVEALYRADSSNELLAEYEYTPFGETRRQSGELSNKNPLRYSTRYHEGNTGLYYYGFRHYSPVTKKWLSQDPMGETGGFNLYQFAGNDPVNSVDILGLCDDECVLVLLSGHGSNNDDEFGRYNFDSDIYKGLEAVTKRKDVVAVAISCCRSASLIKTFKGWSPKGKRKLLKGFDGIEGNSTYIPPVPKGDGTNWKDIDDEGNLTPLKTDKVRSASEMKDLLSRLNDLAKKICEKGGIGKKKCKSVRIEVVPSDNDMKAYHTENNFFNKKAAEYSENYKNCP